MYLYKWWLIGLQAIETKDIVIKKMVYLYLCNYAHSEPEMAIMCINSLRRDWCVSLDQCIADRVLMRYGIAATTKILSCAAWLCGH